MTVFDEVVTGFRLARGGGQEYYRAQCDLAAYGKALSRHEDVRLDGAHRG